MQDSQAFKELIDTQVSYLGKSEAEVNTTQLVDELKSFASAPDVTWYPGTVNMYGFVKGSESGTVTFGDKGDFSFSGSMWTSPVTVQGGGGGPWSTVPSDGQEMEFIWWGASTGGGSVNIIFKLNGYVVGTMVIVVFGMGLGGGHGTVTWRKGS